MKPDWDKLSDEYADSKTSLIADVDCTADGKDLCSKQGVSGYPTIKHGDPNDLQDYKGGRDLDSLKKFADENLGPTCGPDDLDLCNDEDKAQIIKIQKMDIDELELAIEEGDDKMKKLESKHKKVTDRLQSDITELQQKVAKETQKKDDAIAKESKKLGLKFKRSVAAAKKKKEEL